MYWLLFSASLGAYIINYFIAPVLPTMGVVLDLVSLVSCGLAWLVARALFRPSEQPERWPPLVVGALFLTCLILYATGPGETSGVLAYVESIQVLIGSAMLFMTFVEAVDGFGPGAPDRRLRLFFATGYAGIVAVSFVANLPGLEGWQHEIRVGLAAAALIGAGLAVRFRLQHPLRRAARPRSSTHRRAPIGLANAPSDPVLARRLRALLETERVYLDPDIKVAHVARRLAEPEYKISQCVVGDMNFSNFNRMINTFRIAEAKRRLSQHDGARPSILTIAMDCGFASIGPFNRAFKAETGMTPSAYRKIESSGDTAPAS
ncbi:MAG: helix-turn-helix domain-containing protein [Pseudomonadota bacterium]